MPRLAGLKNKIIVIINKKGKLIKNSTYESYNRHRQRQTHPHVRETSHGKQNTKILIKQTYGYESHNGLEAKMD
jgi:hypothetical protein